MTTAAESHDAQLAAIKAKHEDVRAKFRDVSVTEVDVPADMRLEQTGLSTALVDELGRFWLAAGRTMRMVFDPNIGNQDDWGTVKLKTLAEVEAERAAAPLDPDDTQAAQGFKAHEEEAPAFTADEVDKMERRSGAPVPINRIEPAHD